MEECSLCRLWPVEELEYTCLLKSTFTQASHDRDFKTWQNISKTTKLERKGLSERVQNHSQHRVFRIEPVFWHYRSQYAPRCNVIRSPCWQKRMHLQGSYVVSRIHYFLEHSTTRQTPCLPARALHRTWDMNAHSSSSVITFIVQQRLVPHTVSPHHFQISLDSRAFRRGVLNHKGFFEYTEILVLTNTTIQF